LLSSHVFSITGIMYITRIFDSALYTGSRFLNNCMLHVIMFSSQMLQFNDIDNAVCTVISANFMLAMHNCAMSGGSGGTCGQLQKAISLMCQHYTYDTAWCSSQGICTFNLPKQFNKITLGWQPWAMVCLNYAAQLPAQENVTEFSRHENLKTYISDKYLRLKRYLLLN